MNDLRHIQAALFDFDGLLIDSEPYWDKADVELLRRRNKTFTHEMRQHVLGRGQEEGVAYFKKKLGLSETVEALMEERLAIMYKSLLSNVKLMQGAEQIINSFRISKVALAIVTGGHKKEKVREILKKFALDSYFPVIITYEDVEKGKPAPDPFLKAAERLQVNPGDCLVLEDSPNGVLAGIAAGMLVYGINKDKEIFSRLKQAGADKALGSLLEVRL